MTAKNAYTTLSDFLKWVTPQDTTADIADDAVIHSILEAVSRFIDGQTCRKFYPTIETRYYDTPAEREIWLDDDLLEVVTVTNADGTALSSSDYNLIPKNTSPHYAIRITKGSTYYWQTNTTDVDEFSIDLAGYWGYRERYSQEGWQSVTTLAEALDASETAIDLTSAASLPAGSIWKVDNEIFVTSSNAGNTATVFKRGDNGSTAATHDSGATVYKWVVQPDIEQACKMISQQVWRRFGTQAGQDENIVTASGVVITPRDVPTLAALTLKRLGRKS